MTKLHPEKIIEYFKDLKVKTRFEDYIFPEELTADYIAEKFGVHKVSVLRKLNQLEKDNILVSKKAYVKDKPGKRLVFFLNEDLVEVAGNLKTEKSGFPYFGYRDFLYEEMNELVELTKTGDSNVTYHYIIKNISNKDITEIHLPSLKFSTSDLNQKFDNLVKIEVDGNKLEYPEDSLRYFKESKPGKVNPTISFTKSKFHSTVSYLVPLARSLKPGNNVSILLKTNLQGCYSNLLKYEYTGLRIQEITLHASIKVSAPTGYKIQSVKRYEDKIFKHGVFVQEGASKIRRTDLEEELKLKITKRSLSCIIDKPVIGNRYLLPFFIVKE